MANKKISQLTVAGALTGAELMEVVQGGASRQAPINTINHDTLTGFVADEHIAHSGVTLTAGAGLIGGGDISASRSFAVGAGTGITVNADDVALSAATLASLALADSAIQAADLGAVAFSDDAADLIGELDDARLSANVPLLNAANVFNTTQRISASNAQFILSDTGGGTNQKHNLLRADGDAFSIRSLDDALAEVAVVFQCTKNTSGEWTLANILADEFQVDAALLDFNGNTTISGSLTLEALSATAISVGANDSGGAGFKLLRVPN